MKIAKFIAHVFKDSACVTCTCLKLQGPVIKQIITCTTFKFELDAHLTHTRLNELCYFHR